MTKGRQKNRITVEGSHIRGDKECWIKIEEAYLHIFSTAVCQVPQAGKQNVHVFIKNTEKHFNIRVSYCLSLVSAFTGLQGLTLHVLNSYTVSLEC